MRFVTIIAALAVGGAAQAQQIEKRDVHIAVGGKSALYYLPLVLTERLNYFKDEGLNVRISDFAGGTRSLEAVVGGSADVVAGAYEHTINMQSRKQSFQAFVLMGAAPQISVGISSKLAEKYKSPKDLKGLKVGHWALIFRQVAAALAHMHRRGVRHGDMKPSKAMLSKHSFFKRTAEGSPILLYGCSIKRRSRRYLLPSSSPSWTTISPQLLCRSP